VPTSWSTSAARARRVSGTIVLIGVMGGGTAPLELGRVVTQAIKLVSATCGSRDMFEDMVRAIDQHELTPAIDDHVYAFDELVPAMKAMKEARHFGKICLDFGGGR
jgi:D-arabinose 1-dehydrogenase-like Zn-dependent alcohol dehydrogenase